MTPPVVEYRASEREAGGQKAPITAAPFPSDQKGVIQMKFSMRNMTGLAMGFLAILVCGALRLMLFMPQIF